MDLPSKKQVLRLPAIVIERHVAFIDEYRLLCIVPGALVLLDFEEETDPKQAIFELGGEISAIHINRDYESSNQGPFSANPELGIVVVTIDGDPHFNVLVIPTDFFVRFKHELKLGSVSWEAWKGVVTTLFVGEDSFLYTFHTQILLLDFDSDRKGAKFRVYDFSPYSRMEVVREREEGATKRCGYLPVTNNTESIKSYSIKPGSIPLATTCSGRFCTEQNSRFYPIEAGFLFIKVGTPVVTTHTKLLTRFTSYY